MGKRGPLPNGQRQTRLGKVPRTALLADQSEPAEPTLPARAPAGLGKAGKSVWANLRQLKWAQPSDQAGAMRLAQLEDERASLRGSLDEHGAVLSKPVTTSRGDVVGSELYANPALRELRRLDAQIIDLLKGFGLTPMARARLGLAVISAKKDSTLTDLLMAKYRNATYDYEEVEIADD